MHRHLYIILLIAPFLTLNVHAQVFEPEEVQATIYYVIGNDVNVRGDTLLNSRPRFKTSFGSSFSGAMISGSWFRYYDEYVDIDYSYIHASLLAEREEFCVIADERADKGGRGWVELLKCYIEQGDDRSLSTTAFIMNTYMLDDIYTGFERCDLVGNLAYRTWFSQVDSSAILESTSQLLGDVQDSTGQALILVEQAQEYARVENWGSTEDILFTLVAEYAEYLFLEFCYKEYEGLFPLENTKTLFRALYNSDEADKKGMMDKLKRLQPGASVYRKLVVDDLVNNIAGGEWDNSSYLEAKMWDR